MANGNPYAAFFLQLRLREFSHNLQLRVQELSHKRLPMPVDQWLTVPLYPPVPRSLERRKRVRKPKWRRLRATLYAQQQALEASAT